MLSESLMNELVRVPEAARFLDISRSKLYGLMETGELAYVKFGKSRRIVRGDLQRLIERNTITARHSAASAGK